MEDVEEYVLNPTLYGLLVRRFGKFGVKIVARGEALSSHIESEPSQYSDDLVPKVKVDHAGEEYMVDCPFCGDTRQRLSINHAYGTLDKRTGRRLTWLLRCYNEECQNSYTNREALYDEIFYPIGEAADDVELNQGVVDDDREPTPIDPPGETILLEDLHKKNPRHKALLYLQSRYFNPILLSKQYSVSYCPDSKYKFAEDRIIVPLLKDGEWYGWQARYIGDIDFKTTRIPKYWTGPGTKRGKLMYNYDYAIKHKTVVIVEGPADVWGFGPQAMGCWGHSVSAYNRKKLVRDLRDDASLVILLDPKPDEKMIARGQPHHIEKLYQELLPTLQGRLLAVYLPDVKSDPGSLERSFMRGLIRKQAELNGIEVSFKKDF